MMAPQGREEREVMGVTGEEVERPEPGWEPREGCVFAFEPDLRWRVVREDEHFQCLWREGGVRCENPARAAINRGKGRGGFVIWQRYCADHLYGRWIEDGQVMCWTVVPEVAGYITREATS